MMYYVLCLYFVLGGSIPSLFPRQRTTDGGTYLHSCRVKVIDGDTFPSSRYQDLLSCLGTTWRVGIAHRDVMTFMVSWLENPPTDVVVSLGTSPIQLRFSMIHGFQPWLMTEGKWMWVQTSLIRYPPVTTTFIIIFIGGFLALFCLFIPMPASVGLENPWSSQRTKQLPCLIEGI